LNLAAPTIPRFAGFGEMLDFVWRETLHGSGCG